MRNAMWVGGGITGMGEIPMLGVKEKGIAKVIRDIFRNGEQGFFYDPSDLKTHYQDSVGITAVNAAGQPVGLMLDKSKGFGFGDELVTNGDFRNGLVGWTAGSNASMTLSNGELVLTTTGSQTTTVNNAVYQSVKGHYAGKHYIVEFDAKYISGGDLSVGMGNQSAIIVSSAQNAGQKKRYTFSLSSISTLASLAITFASKDVLSTWSIDNISCKQVLGNHSYQVTSAARPIFRQKPILGSDAVPKPLSLNSNEWALLGAGTTADGASFTVTGSVGAGPVLTKLEVGKEYLVDAAWSVNSNVPIEFRTGNSSSAPLVYTSSARKAFFTFKAVTTNLYLRVPNFAGPDTFTFNKLNIKEVTGYRTDQNYIEYDGVDDKLITNLPAQLNNCTVLRATPDVGTQVKYNQSLPVLYEDSVNHAGLVVINRALTRTEQLRLMDELDKRAGATSLETLTFKTFDNNQAGFVFDPNDLSTMFQDSTGTIPVTTAGQPVGLMLDKSKNLFRQKLTVPESSSWAKSSLATVEGNKITLTGLGGVVLTHNTPSGQLLHARIKYTKTPDVILGLHDTGSVSQPPAAFTTTTAPSGELSAIFYPKSTGIYIRLASAGEIIIQSITLDVVPGNHAVQTTSASRPILRNNAVTGANYLEFDGVDDHLLASLGGVTSDFTTGHACEVIGSATKSIFSGETAGYLRTSNNFASVYSNTPKMYPRNKKDVLVQKVANGKHTLTTNLGGGDASDPIEPAGSVFWKPYSSIKPKVIGNFSPTHAALAVAMNYYGGFFVVKDMTSLEETNFRNLFNKRMGI